MEIFIEKAVHSDAFLIKIALKVALIDAKNEQGGLFTLIYQLVLLVKLGIYSSFNCFRRVFPDMSVSSRFPLLKFLRV